MKKKHKGNGVVFNDPDGSLKRIGQMTQQDRQRYVDHCAQTCGGIVLPPVRLNGELFNAAQFRA